MGTTDNTAADDAVRNLQTASANRDQRTASTNLAGSVGIGGRNTPDDVKKVSGALAANGLMHAPQAHADGMLFKGIIGAQERMDSSLKRDGDIGPKTTDAFRSALAENGPEKLTKSYTSMLGFSD